MGTKKMCYRPHDYVYDPLFIVSGPKDHYKAGIIAKMSMAKFQVCPVFSNMFSDMRHYPNKQMVLRKPGAIPSYKEQCKRNREYYEASRKKPQDIQGKDRAKYFTHPVTHIPNAFLPFLHFEEFTLKKVPSYANAVDKKAASEGKMNAKTQTDYRESSAQTSPWQPPYKVLDSGNPRILKLDFLKWGSGLPAGRHEIVLIERAKMKRAWEKQLPPITNDASLKKRRDIIDAMERDEWAFREQEIQEIQELRLKLLENMLSELYEKSKFRSEAKLKNIAELKIAEKNKKIEKLRHATTRELRKLEMAHKGVNNKYHPTNVVDDHHQHRSELWAPQMRHGENPKRWHQILDDHMGKFRAQFTGVEHFNTLPKWLDMATQLKDDYTMKLPGTRLCMRETKWTTPVLKQLYEELSNLRPEEKTRSTLLVRLEKPETPPATPEVEGITDEDEEKYQASIALQSTLKGRAAQILIYEGRDKCRELIQELKYSQGLLEGQRNEIQTERINIKNQQRDETYTISKMETLSKFLNKLQGKIVGSLLDFLNKELRRLLDERRAHAICFLNERERNNREAAEAGRRQKELRRRREHDEIFKQMVKVHQESVDLYLQDIIVEGMDFASTEEAEIYIRKLSEQINLDPAQELEQAITVNEQEEIVADLVHHFVLSEVNKELIRDKVKKKQNAKLKNVHACIFKEINTVAKPPSRESVAIIEQRRLSGVSSQDSVSKGGQSMVKSEGADSVRSGFASPGTTLGTIESGDSKNLKRQLGQTRLPTLKEDVNLSVSTGVSNPDEDFFVAIKYPNIDEVSLYSKYEEADSPAIPGQKPSPFVTEMAVKEILSEIITTVCETAYSPSQVVSPPEGEDGKKPAGAEIRPARFSLIETKKSVRELTPSFLDMNKNADLPKEADTASKQSKESSKKSETADKTSIKSGASGKAADTGSVKVLGSDKVKTPTGSLKSGGMVIQSTPPGSVKSTTTGAKTTEGSIKEGSNKTTTEVTTTDGPIKAGSDKTTIGGSVKAEIKPEMAIYPESISSANVPAESAVSAVSAYAQDSVISYIPDNYLKDDAFSEYSIFSPQPKKEESVPATTEETPIETTEDDEN